MLIFIDKLLSFVLDESICIYEYDYEYLCFVKHIWLCLKKIFIIYNMLEIKEIFHTCSLGSVCHSSQMLKRNKYKLCSYPFDWIYSNCDNIIDCIEDDFNIFLDKSYYINISFKKYGHSKYEKYMWRHHNSLKNIDHYNYYVRCVDRFRSLLKKQEHKLFVMMLINKNSDDFNDDFKNKIIDFDNKFSKHTNNYTLLVICHMPNQQQTQHTFMYCNNVHFLELHTLSISTGLKFENCNDNIYLDNIIKSNYVLNIEN